LQDSKGHKQIKNNSFSRHAVIFHSSKGYPQWAAPASSRVPLVSTPLGGRNPLRTGDEPAMSSRSLDIAQNALGKRFKLGYFVGEPDFPHNCLPLCGFGEVSHAKWVAA
jgi:hypothetical protein